MTTLTVEIDKEQDLPAIEAFLKKMGVEYQIETDEDDDWGDIPPEAIEGIKAGLADGDAGRVRSHEEAMAHIQETVARLRKKNG
ncbi:MAG: hypothetical protein JSU01_00805 [Bacteroidetes bacterium]|nr:hypothetical protein [Bacteroidota bacterium]